MSLLSRSATPRWLRATCAATAMSFTWTFILSIPVIALAQGPAKQTKPSAIKPLAPWKPGKRIPPPASLKQNLTPLTNAQALKLNSRHSISSSVSLFDNAGHLAKSIAPAQLSQWKSALKTARSSEEKARLHLWLGEAALSQDSTEPAKAEFAQAMRLVKHSNPIYGVAKLDTAHALYINGRYQETADTLRAMLKTGSKLRGFDRRETALFLRHALACTGYHDERSKAGITEPGRADPLCGVAGLAVCLKANGLPFDKPLVLKNTKVTGRGSSMTDLVTASKKLGLNGRLVTADEAGLQSLPKPLIAFVEHDHFITITKANKSGVSYVCSDCGAWPGGNRDLNWKQWRLMEASVYMTATLPGSDADRALDTLSSKPEPAKSATTAKPTGLQLANYPQQSLAQMSRLADRLRGHALNYVYVLLGADQQQRLVCGGIQNSGHCPANVCCPEDAPPMKTNSAPSSGDPVNLATGEEEYAPGADLSVYNPIGTSVFIGRQYNSLRGPDATYESDDFGIGWTHNYNYSVYDPTINVNARVQQGTSASLANTGFDAPVSGRTWDVVQGSTTIASSATPNGWSASYIRNQQGAYIQLVVPASATVGFNYEVRVNPGQGFTVSTFFDVYASGSAPQVPQGGTGSFAFTGSAAPGAGLTWDILSGTTVVATSANPKGWNVVYNVSVSAPTLATAGTYTVRSISGQLPAKSGGFQVYAVRYIPKTGVRYLIEPNGARIPITANSIPTSANPVVTCTVPNGVPMLVKWNYSSASISGYYTITMSDNTTLTTTLAAKSIGNTAIMMVLGQMTDRNGNSLNFYYGATGDSGFPLLTDIADTNNNDLVIFNRNANGNITAINDRYGRSIVYHFSTFATTNVPVGWTQSYQEVDHVSQITTTGTTNPPDRYAYGYYSVPNGEGSEQVPFLHTITVPSPTGTGNASATINYRTDGTCTVSSLVDVNGNSRNYSATDANHTKVTIKDSLNNIVYAYTSGFDGNMSGTTKTDGVNIVHTTNVFASPNTPYEPSSVTDALNHTWNYTYDQYGHWLTSLSPRNLTTTNTYNYSSFALGRLVQSQVGNKTSTNYTYFEPSGLLQTAYTPLPGTSGSGQQVSTNYTGIILAIS